MANATIPDLTALGANVAVGDLLEIADISNANASRKVTQAELVANTALGTPTSLVGTNITGTAAGLTAGAASAVAVGGITGLGAGVGTFLATPTSANLLAAVTGETGTGALVFGSSPTIDAPTLTGTTTAATVNATNANVTNFLPVSNDGAAIGASGTAFSDLFLASGAVINFNAGNLTLTHSAGVLTSNGAYVGTVGTFSATTSLLLGTAGSAVGNIGFRNATSGTATLAPPTGALGTYSVTLPNAASTLPIFGQQVTFSGPTAARTVTLPDENFSVGFRGVPQNAKTGSYTLLATDAGRVIPNTTGGWTVNNSVHAAGDVITVYNDSGSSQNITAGTITTMRLAGTATTGTRALAQRGLATLYFQTASEVIVSGAGVT